MTNTTTTIKQRWSKLDGKRSGHLERQRKCASLTIPALLPPHGTTECDQLDTPFQSLGARGVNNLASKLLLILLPPNSPFFRLVVSSTVERELLEMQDERALTKLEMQLGDMERQIHRYIDTLGVRVPLYRVLRLLIATGNAMLYLPDTGRVKVYRLDQYVCVRDPKSDPLEMIIREEIARQLLPDHLQEIVLQEQRNTGESEVDLMEKPVELFTSVVRDGDHWTAIQEVAGIQIPESFSQYPLHECPWIPLRWTDTDGECYGRGLVDEILGDLISLDGLTEAIVEGSAAMAKVLFLIHPAGLTAYEDLADTPNLGFAPGRIEDVGVLQLMKHADFQVANQTRVELLERLSQAFMLNSSIQRNAERVTAEEIRYMAQELEDALGGVYSMLSQELQLPFIRRCMAIMRNRNELPVLPDDSVTPFIVTGIEALGRGHDLRKLQAFMELLAPLGPEAVASRLSIAEYIDRCANGLGMDTKGLVLDDEACAANSNAQMLQQLIGQAGPDVIQEVIKGVMGMTANQTQKR